jgi:hypothetical protein
LGLLPLEFAFWIGFALPLGPVVGLARPVLVFMAWSSLRGPRPSHERYPRAEDAIERANRALAEIRAREATDEREAADHRSDDLTR